MKKGLAIILFSGAAAGALTLGATLPYREAAIEDGNKDCDVGIRTEKDVAMCKGLGEGIANGAIAVATLTASLSAGIFAASALLRRQEKQPKPRPVQLPRNTRRV